ncbi:DUF1127 domain-containing protein [Methylobacterium soli]|nr:hypothetical protein AEGHOMDF_3788 [Methylobacterium soli]
MWTKLRHTLQIWWCTRRSYRELEALDGQSLADMGLNPYAIRRHRDCC